MDELKHYGTKGQKWGVRKYQNPDGSYTELGKERRRVGHDDASDQSYKAEIGKSKTYGKLGFFKRMKLKHQLKEARKKAEDKKRAINEGDIAYASEHINDFTSEEIEKIVNRRWDMEKVYRFQREDEARARATLDAASQKFAKKMNTLADVTKSMANIKKNLDALSGKKVPDKEKDKKKGDKAEKATFFKRPKDDERDDKPRFMKKKKDSQNDQNDSTEEPSGLKTKKHWFMEAASKVDTPSNPKRKNRKDSSDYDDDVKVSKKSSWFNTSDDDLDYKVSYDYKRKSAAESAWDKYVKDSKIDWDNTTVQTKKNKVVNVDTGFKFDVDAYKPYRAPRGLH